MQPIRRTQDPRTMPPTPDVQLQQQRAIALGNLLTDLSAAKIIAALRTGLEPEDVIGSIAVFILKTASRAGYVGRQDEEES